VDIMPHPGTSEETIRLIEDLAERLGLNAVTLKRENSGYVFNAMLSAFLDSAETLAANGVSSVEDIDRSWMAVFHSPLGPFGIMDSIGLDTVWKVNDFWAQRLGNGQFRKNADFLKRYIDQGKLGVKSGEGFYRYPRPEYGEPDFTRRRKP
jgi:3-hydroxybutyryl-CoA dehydrogenase